jgi:hypothetical protein
VRATAYFCWASHWRRPSEISQTYGGFIDAFVLDALYANGSVMTQLHDCG